VIDLIRGKSVKEAEAILRYTPKAATEPVAKLLKSAVANAENNLEMNREELYIAEIYANQGPSLKRFQPVSHGRASAILKRSSHIIKDWNTRWYASKKDFADFLVEDRKIRDFVKKKYFLASISRIEIDRAAGKITVSIFTARPGLLIGKGGAGIEAIKEDIKKATGKDVSVNIMEIRDADSDAQLVAENIASQLEKRISFRRAMKQAMGRAMQKNSVKGIKLMVSGRLGGAEIARSEGYHDGSIPLQTIRADIQYGFAEAKTTYGRIGCKVWIYKGELLGKRNVSEKREEGGK